MASSAEEEVIQGFITATKQALVPGTCDAQLTDQSDEKVETASDTVVARTGKLTKADDVTTTSADQYAGLIPVEEPIFMQDTTYETTTHSDNQDDQEIHGAQQLKQFLKQSKPQEQENESHENVSNKFTDIISNIQEPAFTVEEASKKDATSANLSSAISNEPERVPIKEPEYIIDQVEIKQKDEKSSNNGISYNETAIHYDIESNTTEGSDKRVPVQEPVCVEEHAYVCTEKEAIDSEIQEEIGSVIQGAQQLRKLLSQDNPPENDEIEKKEEKIEEEAFTEEVYEAKYEICKDAASAPTKDAVIDAFVTASKQTVVSEPWIEQEKKDVNETKLSFDEEAKHYDIKTNTTQSSAPERVPVHEPECVEEHAYVCGTKGEDSASDPAKEKMSSEDVTEKFVENMMNPDAWIQNLNKVETVTETHEEKHFNEVVKHHERHYSEEKSTESYTEQQSIEPKIQGVQQLRQFLSQDQPPGNDIIEKKEEKIEEEAFTEEVYEAKYEICKDAASAPKEEAIIDSFITASKQTAASQPPAVQAETPKEDTKIPVQEPAFIVEQAAKKDTKSSVQEPSNAAANENIKTEETSKNIPLSKAKESLGSSLDGRVPVDEPECVEEHTYVCTDQQSDGQKNKKFHTILTCRQCYLKSLNNEGAQNAESESRRIRNRWPPPKPMASPLPNWLLQREKASIKRFA